MEALTVYESSTGEDTYKRLHPRALVVGGCSALVAVTLSLYLSLQHLRSYTNPSEQKWIVGVIFLVPVYATESVISLWNPNYSLVCDTLRDCYEAYALYSFGSYLVACLGGERRVNDMLDDQSRKQVGKPLLEGGREIQNYQSRSFWNFFFQPCSIGSNLFTIEKFGLVQYMILKTFCAFLAFLLELLGVYGDGEFKWYYGYPYITVVLNFSQMWALYCLVQFYNVTHERLKSIRPLPKFISFKAIVFATWWQGVGIALLSFYRVLPNGGKFQIILQEFLVCIEMAIAALAHMFVFSAEPYQYIPASNYGRMVAETTKAEVKVGKGDSKKPAMIERTELHVDFPGTSVTESVQDIVVQGGQCVVKDVVLTINQAIGPVEKGVTKIQETFRRKSDSSEEEEEINIEVEEHISEEEEEINIEVEEHIKQTMEGNLSHVDA